MNVIYKCVNIYIQKAKYECPGLFLPALVKFHILNTVQCSEAIMGGAVYETLEGNTVEVGCDGDSLTVNGVKMVKRKDIVTVNGVIHLIDEVLIPDTGQ